MSGEDDEPGLSPAVEIRDLTAGEFLKTFDAYGEMGIVKEFLFNAASVFILSGVIFVFPNPLSCFRRECLFWSRFLRDLTAGEFLKTFDAYGEMDFIPDMDDLYSGMLDVYHVFGENVCFGLDFLRSGEWEADDVERVEFVFYK